MFFNSFMSEALVEAKKALKNNEVPIGAIVVDNATGKIIGRGFNLTITNNDPSAHAEVVAIREACKNKKNYRLTNCSIYVTLEPCPMCAYLISISRIEKLYYGASDSKSGGVEHGPKIFNSSSCHFKPEIYSHINELECSKILTDFFKDKRISNKGGSE